MKLARWLSTALACALLSAATAAEAPEDPVARARKALLEQYDAAIAKRAKQGDGEGAQRLRDEKRAILRAIDAIRLTADHPKVALDPKRLEQYVGRYTVPPDRLQIVTAEGGRLFVQGPWNERKVELLPVGRDTFLRADWPQLYAFYRDEAGKVTELVAQRPPEQARRLDTAGLHTLRVAALVDGRSRLVLKGNTARWHHLDWDVPGRRERGSVPTELNGAKWHAVWPDLDGGRNRFACCTSSPFRGLDPALPRGPMEVGLGTIHGRGRVAILDRPCRENDYTLIVEIDDYQDNGSRYLLEIFFRKTPGPPPEPADDDAGTIPTEGLVLHLPFAGNARDASGGKRHGTVAGATPTEDRFGKPANAYAFSGDGDLVRVPAPPRKPDEPLTASAWIQYDKLGRWWHGAILSQDNQGGPVWQLAALFDRIAWRRADRWWSVGRSSRAVPRTWYHVAVVFDGKHYAFYLDGELLDRRPGRLPAANEAPITIGGRQWPQREQAMFLAGKIDDVRLYNRALSRREIAALTHEGGFDRHPLVEAAARGQLETVRQLVAAKADVNAATKSGRTPLRAAAEAGHAAVAKWLLGHGAQPDARNPDGETATHAAARAGHLELLMELLGADADVNARTRHQRTPLHAAAAHGHAVCAEFLLAAGANPNAPDGRGNTPLHRAAAYGHIELASLLLKAGANPLARNRQGKAPAQTARDFGHRKMEAALRQAAKRGAGAAEF